MSLRILKFEDIIKLRIDKVRYITETAFFLIVSMTCQHREIV